jgi:hypothetical protein
MSSWLSSSYDIMLEITSETLIGAMGLALALGVLVAGLDWLIRRKFREASTALVVLVMVSNLGVMLLAAGFVRRTIGRAGPPGRSPAGRHQPNPFSPYPGPSPGPGGLANRILRAADQDGDGKLTPDEAAAAASRFVKQAGQPHDRESLDIRDLTDAILQRLNPAGELGPGPQVR